MRIKANHFGTDLLHVGLTDAQISQSGQTLLKC